MSCLCKHPSRLSTILSGAFDGEIRMWNLTHRTCMWNFLAHDGIIRGIVFSESGENFISVGDDKTIKTWKMENSSLSQEEPINTVISKVGYQKLKKTNIILCYVLIFIISEYFIDYNNWNLTPSNSTNICNMWRSMSFMGRE